MQIGNNIYEFNREDAFRFAQFVGHKAQQKGNELIFLKCPYCGVNSNKTNKFAINLETGKFNCFRASCGAKGNMFTLSKDFNFTLSEEVNRYINLNNYNGKFKKFIEAHRVTESKDEAVEYLKSRGISEDICRRYEITVKADQKNVLVFPFKNEDGELTFIKYRNITYKNGDKGSKEWCESNCMPILFGMNQCNLDNKQLIITEGQMDSLSVAECGFENAVSVPIGCNGFTWIPHCWNWLQNFTDIVVFGDCEKGHITLADTISKRFPRQTRIVNVEDYQGFKDANDILRKCGKDAIVKAINNASRISNSRIKYMEDVEVVDVENVETIKTNIKEIDDILTGGFKVGSLVVLSGKRGNGKSTVASYFGVEALNQAFNDGNVNIPYKVFMYSGELPNFFVRNWIDRQIIGANPLTNGQIAQAGEFYRKRLLLFDNDGFDEEDKSETEILMETMEDAIQREGVKFIVLDNLMTAMDDVSSNDALYQGQRKFVRGLSKLAKKYEVIIILVAHPRKSNADFENDSVSGSSVITDAADLVMSYDKINDEHDPNYKDETCRVLSITKNRLTGKIGKVKLWFSQDSKRITGADHNFVREYIKNSFKPVGESEVLPWE